MQTLVLLAKNLALKSHHRLLTNINRRFSGAFLLE